MTEGAVDGRRQRSERSRQAVIEALLRLYDEGTVRPTVAQIAERSGVSERSVFRHFADLEDLASSALARQMAEVLPWFADPPADGDLHQRCEAIVDQRIALHGRMANLARAAAYHAVSSPTVAGALADRRRLLRAQVARQFAAEIEASPQADRRRLLAVLDQALSLEALDYLASPSGGDLSDDDLRAVLLATVSTSMTHCHQGQEDR